MSVIVCLLRAPSGATRSLQAARQFEPFDDDDVRALTSWMAGWMDEWTDGWMDS